MKAIVGIVGCMLLFMCADSIMDKYNLSKVDQWKIRLAHFAGCTLLEIFL